MITGKVIQFMPNSLRVKIENNYELRAIIGNVNWLTFENILRNLIGMFIFGWIARYLGPDDFGILNYTIAFVSLFIAFSTLGLDDIVVRSLISAPEKTNDYLGSTLVLKLIGSLLMMLFSIVGIVLIEKGDTLMVLYVLILSFGYVFKSFDVIDLWFKSKVRSQYSVYARSMAFIIVSAIKVVLILVQAPLVAFVSMYSLDFVLSAIFLFLYYRKESKLPMLEWKFNKQEVRQILLDSWPLFLGGITLTIQSQLDQVLLKNMIGVEEIGIYSAGLKIITSFSFFSAIIRSSFLPSIISAKKESPRLYEKKLQQFNQIMMVMFLLISIPLIILREPIVKILYGNEYLAVTYLLPFLTSRLFFNFYNAARSNFLLVENYIIYSFITTLITTIANILLNLYLIPKYQALGSIIAFSISFFLMIFVIDLIYSKTRKDTINRIKSIFNFYRLFIPRNE